jgi:hypothetical protein
VSCPARSACCVSPAGAAAARYASSPEFTTSTGGWSSSLHAHGDSTFRGRRAVEVARSGRWHRGTADLVEDAEQVAAALGHVLAAGTSARMLGLRVEPGHVVAAQDIRATGRKLLRLDLV